MYPVNKCYILFTIITRIFVEFIFLTQISLIITIFRINGDFSYVGVFIRGSVSFCRFEHRLYVTSEPFSSTINLLAAAFMINHSKAFHIALISCVSEYCIEYLFYPDWKQRVSSSLYPENQLLFLSIPFSFLPSFIH